MKGFIIGLVSLVFSCILTAANIPPDYQGAQELEELNCVSEAAQNCINNICLTSENRDCQDKCSSLAEKKCLYQQDE